MTDRRQAVFGAALGAALVVLAGCTATPDGEPPPRALPPAPPAACVLDAAALAATTGETWVPDQTTASDTRCVYDAVDPAGTGVFMAVDLVPATSTDVAAELDTIGEVCDSGSRAPVSRGDGGFVCRFRGGNVYGALARDGQMLTVSTSAVPQATTAARIVVALSQQLGRLAG